VATDEHHGGSECSSSHPRLDTFHPRFAGGRHPVVRGLAVIADEVMLHGFGQWGAADASSESWGFSDGGQCNVRGPSRLESGPRGAGRAIDQRGGVSASALAHKECTWLSPFAALLVCWRAEVREALPFVGGELSTDRAR